MTDLVLVRHGETIYHAENRYAGSGDVPLTDTGLAEASRLGRWAGDAGLAAVIASPLSRAARTARPAAETIGVDLVLDERLTELDVGDADGLTRDEMRERFPEALDAFLAAPASSPLPGGEAGAAAVARATPALVEAVGAHPGARVLVVAHQTLLRLLLCALIGVPLDRYRALFPRLDPVALTEIRLPDGWAGDPDAAIVRLNAQLAGCQRSGSADTQRP